MEDRILPKNIKINNSKIYRVRLLKVKSRHDQRRQQSFNYIFIGKDVEIKYLDTKEYTLITFS